jgi:hypothetical protein
MTFQLGGFGSIPIQNRIIIIIILVIIIIKGKKKKKKKKEKKKGEPRLVKIKEEGLGEEEDFSILCCYICGRRKI